MSEVLMARLEAIEAEAEADKVVETETAKKRRENRERRIERFRKGIALAQEDILLPDDEGEYVGYIELRRRQGLITPKQKK